MGKNLRISSYIRKTLHPIPSKFSYIWGNFSFLFYQCIERGLKVRLRFELSQIFFIYMKQLKIQLWILRKNKKNLNNALTWKDFCDHPTHFWWMETNKKPARKAGSCQIQQTRIVQIQYFAWILQRRISNIIEHFKRQRKNSLVRDSSEFKKTEYVICFST